MILKYIRFCKEILKWQHGPFSEKLLGISLRKIFEGVSHRKLNWEVDTFFPKKVF